MGVVAVFVVVRVSKTKAAYDSLAELGVEERDRRDDRKCDLRVVLPAPDSPLETC